MIPRPVRTLALALSLTAGFLADPAAAQNAAPALRANVTVVGDIVRIGDLIEHAGAVDRIKQLGEPVALAPIACPAFRRATATRAQSRVNPNVSEVNVEVHDA